MQIVAEGAKHVGVSVDIRLHQTCAVTSAVACAVACAVAAISLGTMSCRTAAPSRRGGVMRAFELQCFLLIYARQFLFSGVRPVLGGWQVHTYASNNEGRCRVRAHVLEWRAILGERVGDTWCEAYHHMTCWLCCSSGPPVAQFPRSPKKMAPKALSRHGLKAFRAKLAEQEAEAFNDMAEAASALVVAAGAASAARENLENLDRLRHDFDKYDGSVGKKRKKKWRKQRRRQRLRQRLHQLLRVPWARKGNRAAVGRNKDEKESKKDDKTTVMVRVAIGT
jgi:hypothetical protein